MDFEIYGFIRDNYGFDAFNRDRGLEITKDEEPEAAYHLPEGDINMYTYSPSLSDLVHPFKPSGDIIVEIPMEMGDSHREMYLSGTEEDFEEMDSELMQRLDSLGSADYFKELL